MITVSESAVKELNEFFSDKEKSPIRVYLAPGGCGGPRLALALDKPGSEDDVFDEAGYSFCINKDLFSQTGDISVDVTYMGFAVESANPMGGGGGCCGCASSGSCASAQ
ncbi:MAG: IscA/HesB family protein [Deltaproteobacteria bacterium]|nr:IscA/HesB family protein [Deltaproteobacteria bacterium]